VWPGKFLNTLLVIKSWNAFAQGKEMKSLRWNTGRLGLSKREPFPDVYLGGKWYSLHNPADEAFAVEFGHDAEFDHNAA
jgi:hypothetical protein